MMVAIALPLLGNSRRGELLLQYDHGELALSLLLVVAIERNPLHYLLPKLLTLLARRHARADGEALSSDLHLGRGVGSQVQIPRRVRIGPALGPYDDVSVTCRRIKQRRRALL